MAVQRLSFGDKYLMRILQLHSDLIQYRPVQKEIAIAEDAEKKEVNLREIVVLFTAVEKGDNDRVAQRAVDEIQSFLKKQKLNRILIYPYAHLSNNLARPFEALRIVKLMEKFAKEKTIETFRAPFGWNKQFTISVKGHPLAEQSCETGFGNRVPVGTRLWVSLHQNLRVKPSPRVKVRSGYLRGRGKRAFHPGEL